MPTLTAPLKESENYNKIVEALQNGSFSVLAEGCAEAQKLHMIYSLYRESSLSALARFRLIVTYSDQRAREIKEAFRFYDKNTVLFPAKDLIFYQADIRGRELDTERIRCLRRIMEGSQTTVVTTFSALMTPQVPLDVLQKSVIEVKKGGELSLTEAAERLVCLGYEKQYQVEKPGQFAIRGGILDVYDLTEDNPIRIELWGDDVEAIHSFDVLSQRSIAPLQKVTIYPATEMILSNSKLRDGFERIRKEEKRVEKLYRDQNHTEEAHRLKTTIALLPDDRELSQSLSKARSHDLCGRALQGKAARGRGGTGVYPEHDEPRGEGIHPSWPDVAAEIRGGSNSADAGVPMRRSCGSRERMRLHESGPDCVDRSKVHVRL